MMNRHLQKATSIIDKFSDLTGIHSLIVDNQAELIKNRQDRWICFSYYCLNKQKCLRDHLLALNESHRLGDLFVHICHQDVAFWCIPLTDHQKAMGGILSGFHLFEQSRHQATEFRRRFSIEDNRELFISSESIRTLSTLQFELAKQERLFDADFFEVLRKRAKIQSDIAGKIIERKDKGEFGEGLIYQKQEELLNSIRRCEIASIRNNFHAVMSEIYIEAITDIDLLKFRMLELFVLVSRTILNVGGKVADFYHLTNQFSKATEELDDIYSFSLWLTDVLTDFINSVIKKRQKLGNIYKAVEYIDQNLTKKLSVSEIASVVAMSKSRFSVAFHQEMGVPFSKYIASARVERAKELLNNTSLSLSEIAMQLGFFDQSHFTRTFKNVVGVTPSGYTKSA